MSSRNDIPRAEGTNQRLGVVGQVPEADSRTSALGPLTSEFAADPDMAEVVDYFLTDLQDRVQRMSAAWGAGSHAELRTLAHQLKGAAGGYGFPTITTSAGELEEALLADQAGMSSLNEKVEALISLCRRAAAGRGTE